jgi:hypothetical protein
MGSCPEKFQAAIRYNAKRQTYPLQPGRLIVPLRLHQTTPRIAVPVHLRACGRPPGTTAGGPAANDVPD